MSAHPEAGPSERAMPPDDDHGLDDLFTEGERVIDAPSDGAEARDLDVFATGEACPLPPLDTVPPTEGHESVTLPGGLAEASLSVNPFGPPELHDHPRYRVLRLLGQGGMGAVYQAEHTLMDRPVALKVIHRHLTDSPSAAERFRREVKTAARLHHPHIVAAYDAEESDGVHFLVMEFVDGESLGERLRRDGRLPVELACDIARQAALGLQFAHEQGMVHRDIKPDNLMIAPDGRVKVLDFGLARFRGQVAEEALQGDIPDTATHSQLTIAGTLMGTPDFIAPEQSDDSSTADIRADIYSLGCTLYQMLAGQVPFPGGTVMERVVKHTAEVATPVRTLRPEVPAGLAGVVEKMMAKAPADRYRTPGEVAEALAAFSRPAPPGDPPRAWPSALVLALLAAVGVLLAVALIGWLR